MENLFKALVEAQKELKNPPKDKQGYGYNYTDLATILDIVKPVLAKHGLTIIQLLNNNVLTTKLAHISGESLDSSLELPHLSAGKMNEVQALGATITYMRRYTISALLCIASEDDTDCATNPENKASKTPITAKEHTLDYIENEVKNCIDLDEVESIAEQLRKKKWTPSQANKIAEIINNQKEKIKNEY